MSRKFLVPIDLTKQELQNARIQNLASAPASPVAGQIYFNTSDATLYFYDGTTWTAAKTNPYSYASAGETTDVTITATESNGTSLNLARADHQHSGPGFDNVTAQTSFGSSSSNGSATTVARSDHSHGTPAHNAAAHSAIKISDLAAPSTDVSFGTSHKITNLADPLSAQDAATKNYVDTKPLNTIAVPIANVSLNSKKITNLADPVDAGDAANKGYVDGAIAGLDWKTAVHLLWDNPSASGTGLSGTLVIDSHPALTVAEVGYRILLTQNGTYKGIYTYTDDGTNYTLVRSDDANTYLELLNASVFVSEGTLYGKTSWVQSNHYLTDFSGQEWVQFAGQGTYLAANGVVLDVNTFKFAPKTDGGLATGSTGAFVKLPTNSGLGTTSDGTAVGAGTGIVVSGGTVAVNTADSNGRVTRRYATSIGDTSATSFTITHNLNSLDVIVQVYTNSDGSEVMADVSRTGVNTVSVAVASAPSADQYRVVVIG